MSLTDGDSLLGEAYRALGQEGAPADTGSDFSAGSAQEFLQGNADRNEANRPTGDNSGRVSDSLSDAKAYRDLKSDIKKEKVKIKKLKVELQRIRQDYKDNEENLSTDPELDKAYKEQIDDLQKQKEDAEYLVDVLEEEKRKNLSYPVITHTHYMYCVSLDCRQGPAQAH